MVMDRFDFSPLFRSTIGFDRLTRLVDAATRVDSASLAYPPYNIEKTGEDAYRLTMAVAGFSPAELDITVQENTLHVTGKGAQKEDENGAVLPFLDICPRLTPVLGDYLAEVRGKRG